MKRKRAGRPAKLTRALADAIVTHIEDGCPLDVAAELECVYRTRAYEWFKKGEADESDGEVDDAGLYRYFRDEVIRARALVTRGVLSEIRTAHYVTKDGRELPDMRARQWYAERVLGYAPTQHVVADVTTAPQAADDTPEAIEASVTYLKLHKGGE